jgi:hypothetical protein
MGVSSHTGASAPRKPITYSRRTTPASAGCSRSVFSNDDEAKDEEAYDRIRQNTGRGIHTGAQRAANLHNTPHSGGAQDTPSAREGKLKKPSIGFANTGTRSTMSKVDTDMKEAIARSLADSAAPSSPPTCTEDRRGV